MLQNTMMRTGHGECISLANISYDLELIAARRLGTATYTDEPQCCNPHALSTLLYLYYAVPSSLLLMYSLLFIDSNHTVCSQKMLPCSQEILR